MFAIFLGGCFALNRKSPVDVGKRVFFFWIFVGGSSKWVQPLRWVFGLYFLVVNWSWQVVKRRWHEGSSPYHWNPQVVMMILTNIETKETLVQTGQARGQKGRWWHFVKSEICRVRFVVEEVVSHDVDGCPCFVALRIPKDPPMEGWMNLYDAGFLFLGPQNDATGLRGKSDS